MIQKSALLSHKSALLGCAMMAALAVGVAPAQAANRGGITRTAVVTPLVLIGVDDLDMGTIIPGPTGGTVTLDGDGTRTSTGSVILVGSNHHPARFAGQGTTNQQVEIDVPISINLTGPGAPMVMTTFAYEEDPATPGTLNVLGNSGRIRLTDPSGAFGIVVSAQLAVGANQAGGQYSATFDVTAEYQ